MSSDVLVCPTCRARVFGHWSSCKFCGATLRVDQIAGTMHPDDLIGSADQAVSGSPAGPRSPWGDAAPGHGRDESGHEFGSEGLASGSEPAAPTSDWSSWAGSGSGFVEDPAPQPAGDRGQGRGGSDVATGAVPASSESDPEYRAIGPAGVGGSPPPVGTDSGTGTLVPLEGADTTWTAGPSPKLEGDDRGALAPIEDGPSGLEPVSWYSEPGTAETTSAEPGASLSSFGDEDGPSGLEPVSWYSEPGPSSGAAVDEAPPPPSSPSSPPEDELDDDQRFDPGAIFRDPEPATAATGAEWDTSSAIETAVPEINWKASASGWDRPIEPKGQPKGQSVLSREARLLLMGIVVVLFVALVGNQIFKKRDNFPNQWASNVEQVANWVSSTRNMPFAHPVAVKTVSPSDYASMVAEAESPAKTQSRFAEKLATLRALGAIEGKSSPELGVVAVQHPEDGAFYDPFKRTLVLRGGTDQAQLGVGIAGAMSVALDDQHADLGSLRSPVTGENPLLTVVAGNADRSRSQYLKTQSNETRRDFEKKHAAAAGAATNFLDAETNLQGALGGPFVQFVHDVNGAKAANNLAQTPPLSSQKIIDPLAFFNGTDPILVSEPKPPTDANEVSSGAIGAQTWYLVIAGRLGPERAFEFVNNWSGDAYVTYEKQSAKLCVTDVVSGSDESTTQALTSILESWAAEVSGGQIRVKRQNGLLISVDACDPGVSGQQSDGTSYSMAVRTAALRVNLAASYYRSGTKIPNGPNGPLFSPEQSWCLAQQVTTATQPATIDMVEARAGVTYRALTLTAGQACGVATVGQLFSQPGD